MRYEADAHYTRTIRDMISHAAENAGSSTTAQYEAIEDLDPAYLEMYKQGRYRGVQPTTCVQRPASATSHS